MSNQNYIHAAKQGAALARTESRPDVLQGGRPATFFTGVVKAQQAAGCHQVAILDEAGEEITVLEDDEEVPLLLDGICTYPTVTAVEVDTIVALILWEGRKTPCILMTGSAGGSGGCVGALAD